MMWGMLALGLALQVVGCITAVVQAPRTELSATGPVEVGDRTLMLVGVLTFGLGGVLSLTAVVALAYSSACERTRRSDPQRSGMDHKCRERNVPRRHSPPG
jgi:di/tricarboxylate transporter